MSVSCDIEMNSLMSDRQYKSEGKLEERNKPRRANENTK